MIQLLNLILMLNFYSCRINKGQSNQEKSDFGEITVIIKNNSDTIKYFNTSDIETPCCRMNYIDDIYRIKEFYFSFEYEENYMHSETRIMPSFYTYKLQPDEKIEFYVKLKEGFDDYYKYEINETNFTISLLGKSLENHFYIYCSTKEFGYGTYEEYCKMLLQYGIKLEGKLVGDKIIEFIID